MSKTQSLETILAGQLADPRSDWGFGSFGAIAEFTRDHDEPATLDLAALSAVTPRGGIRCALRGRAPGRVRDGGRQQLEPECRVVSAAG